MDAEKLIEYAKQARELAYAPYSGFKVGAALLAHDGTVYEGCNIENAAFTPGNCAERTAFFKAVSEGQKEFDAIAIVGGDSFCAPCGVCRQVMREFCADTFKIIMTDGSSIKTCLLKELLPMSFGPDQLKNHRQEESV